MSLEYFKQSMARALTAMEEYQPEKPLTGQAMIDVLKRRHTRACQVLDSQNPGSPYWTEREATLRRTINRLVADQFDINQDTNRRQQELLDDAVVIHCLTQPLRLAARNEVLPDINRRKA